VSRVLKVGFAGTPEFARPALLALLGSRHQVALVLTQPDRPSGRGLKLTASPVKDAALRAGLAVLQPTSLKLDGRAPAEAAHAHAALKEACLDVLVVAAYGLILPQSVLELPALGCLNIHASLLPRWRGAAPVQRAIEAGDVETGVDIMQMDAGLDTGAVLLEVRCNIRSQDTAKTLTDRLAKEGAGALLTALEQCANGTALPRAQSEEGVTYAKKISKAEAALNWTEPALQLERRIRAFDPTPGASAMHGAQLFKIWGASVQDAREPAPPGRIMFIEERGIGVACGEDVLVLEILQRAGGRRVAAADFQRTGAMQVGEVLH